MNKRKRVIEMKPQQKTAIARKFSNLERKSTQQSKKRGNKCKKKLHGIIALLRTHTHTL